MSLVYYARGTLGKIKKSVNTVSIGDMPDDSGRKPAFLNVRIIISDQFSYRYHIIAFYGDLNCPDYYLSLNLGGSLRNFMDSFFNTMALHLFAYPASHSKTVFLPGNFQSYETLERRPLTSESYC